MLKMVLLPLKWIVKILMSIFDPTKIQMTAPQFPLDQVIGVKTGSFGVAAGGPSGAQTNGFDSWQTGFGDQCLFIGLFSVDNGASWYTDGSSFPNGVDSTAGQLTLQFGISADVDGTVGVNANNTTRSAYTVLYQVAMMSKPDQPPLTPMPTVQKLSYKSNLNYMKIAKEGVLTLPNSGSQVINHGLGYVPNFLIWTCVDENVTNDQRVLFRGGTQGGVIDSQNLTLKNPFSTRNAKMYYRIYLDA